MIDITTLAVVLAAISVAILSGLLPGIPSWICPFFLLPFIDSLTINQIVLFWIISVLGSQFFGTIASVTFGIPGESSTLIFNHYTRRFSLETKQAIIKRCADSSAIASVISLIAVLFGQSVYIWLLPILGKTIVIFGILLVASCVIIFFTKSYLINFLLFCVGALMVPKSNIALPEFFIKLGTYTYDVSLVSFIIGLILVPKLLINAQTEDNSCDRLISQTDNTNTSTFIGTTVGIVSGFLPGPTATISSVLAFRANPGNLFSKIVSATAADHSVIPIGAFLFLYLQIPLSIDAVVVNGLLTQKDFDITHFALYSNLIPLFLTIMISLAILWILARKTYRIYSKICNLDNNKILILTVTALMLYLDFLTAGGSYNSLYFVWLTILSITGITLQKFYLNPMPLIMGFILGDSLVWTSYQIVNF